MSEVAIKILRSFLHYQSHTVSDEDVVTIAIQEIFTLRARVQALESEIRFWRGEENEDE